MNTSARALFLCPLFKTEGGNKLEVPKNENQDYVGLQRVQTEKLRHGQEQEKRPRQTRTQEILQILP